MTTPFWFVEMSCALIGVKFDLAKSLALQQQMTVLGARVGVSLALKAFSLSVDTEKMERWIKAIDEVLAHGTMAPAQAMTFL